MKQFELPDGQLRWLESVVSDPSFPAVCMAAKTRMRIKNEPQNLEHLQHYAGGYAAGFEDFSDILFEMVAELRSPPPQSTEGTYVDEPDFAQEQQQEHTHEKQITTPRINFKKR